MTTQSYEFVVLFSPELNDDQLQQAQDFAASLVKKYKGKIVDTDIWGKKVLAYPINKHTEAFYVFYKLDMPVAKIQAFEKEVYLTESIIRHLIVKAEEKEKNEKQESKIEKKKESKEE